MVAGLPGLMVQAAQGKTRPEAAPLIRPLVVRGMAELYRVVRRAVAVSVAHNSMLLTAAVLAGDAVGLLRWGSLPGGQIRGPGGGGTGTSGLTTGCAALSGLSF